MKDVRKVCTGCRKGKPVDQFYKDSSKKDGLTARCSDCTRTQSKKTHASRADVKNERRREWYKDNKESESARAREWRANNLERAKYSSREYYNTHKGETMARTAKRRALVSGAYSDLPNNFMDALISFYECCLRCGTFSNLTHDHVVPLSIGGEHTFRNSQLLCGSCNSWKGNRSCADFRSIDSGILVGISDEGFIIEVKTNA